MGVQELIDAFRDNPVGPDDELTLAELIGGLVGFIPDGTSVVGSVLQIDPVDAVAGSVRQAYVYGDGVFKYDAADGSTAHDGITTLVLIGGKRYKLLGDIRVKAVEAVGFSVEPTPSAYGQAWIDITGIVGAANSIIVHTSRGWVEVDPDYGPPIFVKATYGDYPANSYVHWEGGGGWVSGIGSGAYQDDTIPLSAIQGCAASLMVRVVNQTTYAPPGSRKTGATPTMPLGGTASNINDNDDTTTGVTSALGDLSGATVASRIIGRLALAAATDLISIEARGVLGSAVSTANAMGLYYSTDNGANWTQAGSGFTLSATAQNIQRNGSFAGVTDIALVTEAKNWSTATNTLAGLNAYDATVTGSVGDNYIIASPAIGIFAGHEGKVARCQVADTYTIYTPLGGDVVHDINLGYKVEWNEAAGAWQSSTGSIFKFKKQRTASTGSATAVASSPSSGYTFSDTTAPKTSHDRLEDAGAGTFSHRALSATNELVIDYQVKLVAPDAGLIAFGLLVDSLTDAVDWVGVWNNTAGNAQMHNLRLTYAPGDTALHTYKIAVFRMAGFSAPTSISRRLATLMEVVVDS